MVVIAWLAIVTAAMRQVFKDTFRLAVMDGVSVSTVPVLRLILRTGRPMRRRQDPS